MIIPPRLLFIISGLERGGAQTQLVNITTKLAQRGWDVTIISFLSPVAYVSELRESNVTIWTLNSQRWFRKYTSLIKAGRMIKKYKPDILVGFMYHGIMTARIIGRLVNVPVVVSAIRTGRDRSMRERFLRLTNALTDKVTTNSHDVAKGLLDRKIVGFSEIEVIPNAIEISNFIPDGNRATYRNRLNVNNDQFLWLAVGRLIPEKDYPTLMLAFRDLSKLQPTARLIVVGSGPARTSLEVMIRRLGLCSTVRLLGTRLDMREIYEASDALILASVSEGMPNVILEAMAAKKPVVSTNVGGVSELVRDEVSGYLIPQGDHVAIARVMHKLMELSSPERTEFGTAGYEHVRANFALDRIIMKWEGLFGSLMNQKSSNRDSLL